MSKNQQKEVGNKNIKFIKNPLNQKTNQKTNTNDIDESISRFNGNILGVSGQKNKPKPILLNKSVGRGNSSKNINNNKENNNIINTKKRNKKEDIKLKIEEINSEILNEKGKFLDEVTTYNNQLSQKQKEINDLNKENYNLISKLKDIRNELDANVKLAKIFSLKFTQLEKEEKNLEKKINVREEEIKIEIKNNEREKKEQEKMQKLLEENKENREIILNDEKNNLENYVQTLQKDIKKLQSLLNEHIYCAKNINNMRNVKNLLDNDYQFELKKLNMPEETEVPIKKKSKSYTKNKIKLKKNNNKEKEKIEINPSAKNFIYKQFELAQKNYIKNYGSIPNIKTINESETIQDRKNLFLSEEINVLKQILPERNINQFNERYNNLLTEKQLIKDRMKKNNAIVNEINNHKMLINYSAVRKKELLITKTGLKSDLVKNRKLMETLNQKIIELNKEIKVQNNILKHKNKENQNYKKHLLDIQNKINNGKLILKQNLNDENENRNNKSEAEEIEEENEEDEEENTEN